MNPIDLMSHLPFGPTSNSAFPALFPHQTQPSQLHSLVTPLTTSTITPQHGLRSSPDPARTLCIDILPPRSVPSALYLVHHPRSSCLCVLHLVYRCTHAIALVVFAHSVELAPTRSQCGCILATFLISLLGTITIVFLDVASMAALLSLS
jgi:hypothetical protein